MNNSCVVKRRREIFMNYSSAKTEDIGFKFRCICDIANKYLKREEGEGGAVRGWFCGIRKNERKGMRLEMFGKNRLFCYEQNEIGILFSP